LSLGRRTGEKAELARPEGAAWAIGWRGAGGMLDDGGSSSRGRVTVPEIVEALSNGYVRLV
ncbi:MAG: hypothetical protein QGD95_09670, partial [Actinomycetota bacterium]|nr:hypothetical protein [Actinomycetota bacterium]